nr:hypothetical protein [Gemmata sp. SH-PL17]
MNSLFTSASGTPKTQLARFLYHHCPHPYHGGESTIGSPANTRQNSFHRKLITFTRAGRGWPARNPLMRSGCLPKISSRSSIRSSIDRMSFGVYWLSIPAYMKSGCVVSASAVRRHAPNPRRASCVSTCRCETRGASFSKVAAVPSVLPSFTTMIWYGRFCLPSTSPHAGSIFSSCAAAL